MKGFVLMPLLLIVAILLTATVDQAAALKCWRCSSDAANAEFCRDPFDEKSLTTAELRWSYVECADPPQAQFGVRKVQHTVCKKLHQTVNGKPVIMRSCFWEDVDAPADDCQTSVQSQASYVEIVQCRTCTTDGCNGKPDFGVLRTVTAEKDDKKKSIVNDNDDDDDDQDDSKKNDISNAVKNGCMSAMLVMVAGAQMWAQLLR